MIDLAWLIAACLCGVVLYHARRTERWRQDARYRLFGDGAWPK